MTARVDVAVVGGGPAGTLSALALARRGLQVALVDRTEPPRRKVCGCCLGARGLAELEAEGLGSLPTSLGARRPTRLELVAGDASVALPLEGTVVVSRGRLDDALGRSCVDAGVDAWYGWRASLGCWTGSHRRLHLRRDVETATLEARAVVAATGLAPLPTRPATRRPAVDVREGSRIGAGAIYGPEALEPLALRPSTVRMIGGAGGYLGLSVLEDGSVNLAGALDPEAVRTAGGIEAAVASILAGAGFDPPERAPLHAWQGTPALTRSAPSPGAEGLFLVGDAAGYVEPFTGEGMTWALASARAAAPIVAEAARGGWSPRHLDRWARRRRATLGSRYLIRAVAWLTRHPLPSRTAVTILRLAPGLALPLVRRATGGPLRTAGRDLSSWT